MLPDVRVSLFHWQENLLAVAGGVVSLVIGYGEVLKLRMVA
jgi:hypothetical protein